MHLGVVVEVEAFAHVARCSIALRAEEGVVVVAEGADVLGTVGPLVAVGGSVVDQLVEQGLVEAVGRDNVRVVGSRRRSGRRWPTCPTDDRTDSAPSSTSTNMRPDLLDDIVGRRSGETCCDDFPPFGETKHDG